ncbi:MAG: hypothetical protein JWQ00_2160 [Noviherbaspirillum sp.]|nr:hypothetical protein [Noviherbaspirillum sp.]
MNRLFSRFFRYLPEALEVSQRERARSVLGALIGIAVTGLLGRFIIGDDPLLPWLIAPMGASAVLLFAVPASPLAQPWPVFGGNVISALIGVMCNGWIGQPLIAATVACAGAIAVMFSLRCLHPPGGAVALTAALGAPGVAQHGFAFALSPVALNSAVILLTALAYSRLCGRPYPHVAASHANPHQTRDPLPSERVGVAPDDLDAALLQYNQLLDVSRDDLAEIFRRTEMNAYQRHFGRITCADIMSRDVVKAEFGTELQHAWDLLRGHHIKALPVVSRFNRVIGIVTLHDFLRQADVDKADVLSARLRRLLKRTSGMNSSKPEVVGQIMTATVQCAFVDEPIASLVPHFSDNGFHHVPVIDRNQRLVGIVSQSDLIAALYRTLLEEKEGDALLHHQA